MHKTTCFIQKCLCVTWILIVVVVTVVLAEEQEKDEEHGIIYPSQCEVCKYVAVELEQRLKETGKTRDVLKLGYNIDEKKTKKIKYEKSELRFIESFEDLCDRMLEYNVHKERKDSTRLAKGMSQTFETLHGLVNKGVKVELGIPYELWDKPSVEVTSLKAKCESMLEKYEDDLRDWYENHQDIPLKHFLCSQRVLRKGDDDCLTEILKDITPSEETATKLPRKAKIEKVEKPKPEKEKVSNKKRNEEL